MSKWWCGSSGPWLKDQSAEASGKSAAKQTAPQEGVGFRRAGAADVLVGKPEHEPDVRCDFLRRAQRPDGMVGCAPFDGFGHQAQPALGFQVVVVHRIADRISTAPTGI